MTGAIGRIATSILLALLLVSPAAAQQPPSLLPHPVLADADMREGTDLSGPWNWSIDPYREGLAGFHGEEAGKGHRRYEDVENDLSSGWERTKGKSKLTWQEAKDAVKDAWHTNSSCHHIGRSTQLSPLPI